MVENIFLDDLYIVMSIASSISLVGGIVGCILTFYIIYKDKTIRVFTRLLFLQQNVFDTLVLLVSGTESVSWSISRKKFSTRIMEIIVLFTILDNIAISGATITLCFMSIERFIVVTWPTTNFLRSWKRFYSLVMFGCTILFSVVVIIPYISKNFRVMQRYHYRPTVLESFGFLIYNVFLPFLILLVAGIQISLVLWRSSSRHSNRVSANVDFSGKKRNFNQNQKISKSIIKVVFITSSYFLICSFPYSFTKLVHSLKLFKLHGEFLDLIPIFSKILIISNSSTRFYFYMIGSQRFRAIIGSLFVKRVSPSQDR